jgi:putative ABC transport system substrate-binding protein
MTADIVGKQLELLKETLGKVAEVSALWNPANPIYQALMLKETQEAAQALGMRLQLLEARVPEEIDRAFTSMARARNRGVVIFNDPVFLANGKRIADLSIKHRLPAVSGTLEYPESGGLMAYGASFPDMYRRAAVYVDKILKGAKPADLPIEQPTQFELAVNMKAAKALGIKIPDSILVRADKVIE